MVMKPSMRSYAPGTLDMIDVRDSVLRFGVSATLWKGSSGGPCVLLSGTGAGTIIGLGKKNSSLPGRKLIYITVQGYELLRDPYNIVNGLPNGLKDFIKRS
jgi:hypothetical protein